MDFYYCYKNNTNVSPIEIDKHNARIKLQGVYIKQRTKKWYAKIRIEQRYDILTTQEL